MRWFLIFNHFDEIDNGRINNANDNDYVFDDFDDADDFDNVINFDNMMMIMVIIMMMMMVMMRERER